MPQQPVLSRHRLPKTYRYLLAALWVTPALILLGSLMIARGISLHLVDPRLLLPLVVMALPALYIWREGVDVSCWVLTSAASKCCGRSVGSPRCLSAC